MRSEYDMVEDVRSVKTGMLFNKRGLKILIGIMLFLIGCGIFLQTTYLFASNRIEMKQKEEEKLVQGKKELSSKTYYIEQRLREDLEKILKQGK